MPELPEVETVVQGVSSEISGKRLEKIEITDEELLRNVEPAQLKQRLEGKRVSNVIRKGKYILIELGDGNLVTIHLRMTGKLLVCSQEEETEHQRISFQFRDDGKLIMDDLRRLGTLDLLESREDDPLGSLGLEPFTDDYEWEDFRELFDTTQALKLILLDQHKISGIGNIYASEILFRAGLNPLVAGNQIEEAEIRRLYEVIPEVMSEAIQNNGTTFSNFLDSNGETGDFQNFLRVYQKEGEPCPECGTEIVKVDQSGRSTYYCPRCQKEKQS